MERVEVENNRQNWINWGKLVKTWATGKNYFKDGKDYPVPNTLAAFCEQLKQAKVQMKIPDWVQSVLFVQKYDQALVVRLPPKEMIEASETQLKKLAKESGGPVAYPLPTLYTSEAWRGQAQAKFGIEELLLFHCERIGEYTINNCV
jgi:hypothetical protein